MIFLYKPLVEFIQDCVVVVMSKKDQYMEPQKLNEFCSTIPRVRGDYRKTVENMLQTPQAFQPSLDYVQKDETQKKNILHRCFLLNKLSC